MKELKELDYVVAAQLIGCEPATIKAVKLVEAPHGGFLDDGRPVILFEAHLFSYATNHQYDLKYPDISSLKWNRKLYIGGVGEYERLNRAKELNEIAALESTSFGMFQILGKNHAECEFKNVLDFVDAMNESEVRQLIAFVKYVKARNLDDELRSKNWTGFAAAYNGPLYKENHYDERLAAAYLKCKPA
jgi:hypothetical protein